MSCENRAGAEWTARAEAQMNPPGMAELHPRFTNPSRSAPKAQRAGTGQRSHRADGHPPPRPQRCVHKLRQPASSSRRPRPDNGADWRGHQGRGSRWCCLLQRTLTPPPKQPLVLPRPLQPTLTPPPSQPRSGLGTPVEQAPPPPPAPEECSFEVTYRRTVGRVRILQPRSPW